MFDDCTNVHNTVSECVQCLLCVLFSLLTLVSSLFSVNL